MATTGCARASKFILFRWPSAIVLGLVLGLVWTAGVPAATPDLGAARPAAAKGAGRSGRVPRAMTAPESPAARVLVGETIADALPITALPFSDAGETCDNSDDYDVACSYVSVSPDVVYAYTASAAIKLDIDLCGSSYDTKVYVLDADAAVLYCNEDYYAPNNPCGGYVSRLDGASVAAGQTVYIVIDGYGGACGDYVLAVTEYAPCELTCVGTPEGEPPLHDNYTDRYNAGCNSPGEVPAITTIQGGIYGTFSFCGKSGFYVSGGVDHRDTDWFAITLGPAGQVEWRLDAEEVTVGYVLELNCPQPGAYGVLVGGRCGEGSIQIIGDPGASVGLWVAPPVYEAPLGMTGHEYDYRFTLTGLSPHQAVAVETTSWGSVKSRYR